MIILSVKTDKKTAEVGLFKSHKKLKYITWQAHRELSITIHKKIEKLLGSQKLSWKNIEGVVFYEGPGSFTGLRIGASVANTIAATLDIPVAQASGEKWIKDGGELLKTDSERRLVVPKYDSDPMTTSPKK